MFEFQSSPGDCPQCGNPCNFVRFGKAQLVECDPCAEREREQRHQKQRVAECLAKWVEVTPHEFQAKIDPQMLADYLLPALSLDGMHGAGFMGAPGDGKTRVAYALLKKAAAAGLKPYAITGPKLRQAATMRTNDPAERDKLKSAQFAQALLIDDVGKGSSTEAGDEALFDLLDQRTAHHRVTFWTANGNSKFLITRFQADRGPAIVRRLGNLAGCAKSGTGNIFQPEQ